jgi:hypothetical protein
MASPEGIVERVFVSVMAPLVLGGVVEPGHPIGARAALGLMAIEPRPIDLDLVSRVDLARTAVARRLVPIDLAPETDGATFALGAALHDLLQVAHPGWVRHASAGRLLDLVVATLDRVPPPRTAREALLRHTWLSRVLAITRKDSAVSWWTGSREFRGHEPPARLMAWPGVRRVHVQREERAVTELLAHGGVVELTERWRAALATFLHTTPLTDLATCAREVPAFRWSRASLALAAAPVTRTLALRALALGPESEVDAALDRATRALTDASRTAEASAAATLLAERAAARDAARSLTSVRSS